MYVRIMYVCIYVCLYVCIFIYVYIYICVCVCECECVRVCETVPTISHVDRCSMLTSAGGRVEEWRLFRCPYRQIETLSVHLG